MRRRAILIYFGAIVLPAIALLYLGFQSFERQRQAIATLTSEKLASLLERRMKEAADSAFARDGHPMVRHWFTLEGGVTVSPALHSPAPVPLPADILDAEREEIVNRRPEIALEIYRKLTASRSERSLALSRVARCLGRLGRMDEARHVWRELAASHGGERDSAHRPYGIVAAIEAGETAGLVQRIESGEWDLPADQAEYFLARLAPGRSSPYLERFRFARELNERFHHSGSLREGEIYTFLLGSDRIYYRAAGPERIRGFAVDKSWVEEKLLPALSREAGVAQMTVDGTTLYGGAILLVLLILGAGVLLLLRDLSREAGLNRLRSDFVSSVSHELKTPLTLIRLYAETLLSRRPFSEADRLDFCAIIARESRRLAVLVDRVLTFSRVERGEKEYHFEHADPLPVVARTVEDYREYFERAGFRLVREFPDQAPEVRLDADAVSQAVVNLLENAMKYSGDGKDVAVRMHASSESVILDVEDHGTGISPAERDRIFDRYYRGAGNGKGGYGIGLYLVRHIMEAHGGRVELRSEPGRGSRFRLIFPVASS